MYKRLLKAFPPLVAAFLALLLVVYIQYQSPQRHLTDQIVFDFNEKFPSYSATTLRAMSFGYSRAVSSLLWIRFLEQTPPKKVEKNQISWIYLDLDAVTELDPEFYPAYEYGGIFLSVITEDKRGAEKILLKGIKEFPDRWRLRSFLAYHYQFELVEPEKAAEQYHIGATLPGAPPILGILATSYLRESNGREAAKAFLEGLIRKADDPFVREKLLEKLRNLDRGLKGE